MSALRGRVSRRRFLGGVGALAVIPVVVACIQERPTVVELTGQFKFEPATLTIARGTTVTWFNNGSEAHTATDDPSHAAQGADVKPLLPDGAKAFDSGDVYPGRSWSHRFETPGRYVYVDRRYADHQMVGSIFVTE